jgi:hypothetical protein
VRGYAPNRQDGCIEPPCVPSRGGSLQALYELAYLPSGGSQAAERTLSDAFVSPPAAATGAGLCASQRWRQLADDIHLVNAASALRAGDRTGGVTGRDATALAVSTERAGLQLLDVVVQRLVAARVALEETARLAGDPQVSRILVDVAGELAAAVGAVREASSTLGRPPRRSAS